MKKLKPNQHIIGGHTVSEKGILFSTEMVKAILEDRKTQTRRVVKDEFCREWLAAFPEGKRSLPKYCPYGKPGDLLYVRETWCNPTGSEIDSSSICYKADWSEGITSHKKNKGIWKPSLHLPKAGSRIWVMIEDIRVERVQEISEEDAKSEGIRRIGTDSEMSYKSYAVNYEVGVFPYVSFLTLWQKINGRDSWDANPWVWVVKFRVLSKTGRPSDEAISSNLEEIINLKSESQNG